MVSRRHSRSEEQVRREGGYVTQKMHAEQQRSARTHFQKTQQSFSKFVHRPMHRQRSGGR